MRCECGQEKITNTDQIKKSSMCRKCRGKIHAEVMKKDYGLNSRNAVLSSTKKGAKKRNHLWQLSDDHVFKLMAGNCFYCGRKPFREYVGQRANGGFIFNGIDRVDNTRGYLLDNCVSCCPECNQAKHTMTKESFLSLVKLIYENHYLDMGVKK